MLPMRFVPIANGTTIKTIMDKSGVIKNNNFILKKNFKNSSNIW